MDTDATRIGHLLRRAGFGLSRGDRDRYLRLGYDRTVKLLLDELDLAPEVTRGFEVYVPGAIQTEWLGRMLAGRAPLAEKLALFWHGHFATSDAKVRDPALMWGQHMLLRTKGAGRFGALVSAVSRDPAMIRWLDGNANRREHPNENYARELQELFTLGVGHFTESDVREAARAFTGWGTRGGKFRFRSRYHDPERKRLHGAAGAFDGDDVVRVLTGLGRCHEYIALRLLRFFGAPKPAARDVRRLAAISRRTRGDIRSMLRQLFATETFLSPRSLVRSPVEFLIGALRAVGGETLPQWSHASLDRMGQTLFLPPSVKGWTSGTGWLGTTAILERLKVAVKIGSASPDAAAWIEATALDGHLPENIRRALDGAGSPSERVTIVLASPEFQRA